MYFILKKITRPKIKGVISTRGDGGKNWTSDTLVQKFKITNTRKIPEARLKQNSQHYSLLIEMQNGTG